MGKGRHIQISKYTKLVPTDQKTENYMAILAAETPKSLKPVSLARLSPRFFFILFFFWSLVLFDHRF